VSDLLVNIRQVGSYPAKPAADPTDLVLLQEQGLGGPYVSATTLALVRGALADADLDIGGILGVDGVLLPPGGPVAFDGATLTYQAPRGLTFANPTEILQLTPAGDLKLPRGTLTVARDPAGNLDVATAQWVRRNTVASFNGRQGPVRLNAHDVYRALDLDPKDPFITASETDAAICRAIQELLRTYPAVWTFNGRLGDVWLQWSDLARLGAVNQDALHDLQVAFLDSPDFTGTPTAPTPAPGAPPNQIVNVQYVLNQIAQSRANSVTAFNGRVGNVALTLQDGTGVGLAPITSPDFLGLPTAPTANPLTATAQIATTAFVTQGISVAYQDLLGQIVDATTGVVTWNGRAGTVTLQNGDISALNTWAPLAGPAFSGNPTAPTPAQGDDSTSIATTAFVMREISAMTAGVSSFNGRSGTVNFTIGDGTGVGLAPIASPAFSGTPTAVTATAGTATTQLATTAFVQAAVSALNTGVTTFNGRTGPITLSANDVTAAGGLANPAPILTSLVNAGVTTYPTSPTPTPGNNTQAIATTAFVQQALSQVPPGITVASTAPASPVAGQGWLYTGDWQTRIWTGSTWVVAVNPPMPDVAGAIANQNQPTINQPTINQPTIMGVTDGSDAGPGEVGEYIITFVPSIQNMPPNVWNTLVGINLTAGDWEISGGISLSAIDNANYPALFAGCCVSKTAGSISAADVMAPATVLWMNATSVSSGTLQQYQFPVFPQRWNVAAPITLYLLGSHNTLAGVGAFGYSGFIAARRVR